MTDTPKVRFDNSILKDIKDEKADDKAAEAKVKADVNGGVPETTKESDPAKVAKAIEAAAKVDGTKGVIVSTRPSGSSRWLRVNLPARARKLLNVPVTHVVTLEAKDGA